MMKTIYLHIGTNKTGTTSIQKQLALHRQLLKKQGILYPTSGQAGSAHYPLSWGLGLGHPPADYKHTPEHWLNVVNEIKHSDCEKIILSSEFFILLRNKMHAEIIRDYLSDFDVKIVVYIRRQDKYLESVYSQAVKMGAKVPSNIMDFYNNNKPSYNYFQVLMPWVEVFGKSNIKLKLYGDRKTFNAVEDFFKIIGESCPFDSSEEKRSNLSWNAHLVRFMAKHRDIFPSTHERAIFVKWFNSKEQFREKGTLLNPNQRKQVLEHHSTINKKIAKQYFDADNLFDDSDVEKLNKSFIPVNESQEVEKLIFKELFAGRIKF
ncbi:hypothetical protein [Endozoicomonas sp. SESOKO2]|uniref:hypothetical protein n=1 Tax=Endozoicomonas sp. SESOKO2 TaxID=2828743 RepID=UPI0021494AD9|nr:hypothetical protein [Endozoicomonas sp. SESOKO2]